MNFRRILLAAGVVLCLAIVVWRLNELHHLDLESLEGREGKSEAQQLFERLRDDGLLAVDAKGLISVEPRDYALARRAAGADAASLKLASRLLDSYYGDGVGKVLHSWIDQWNRGRLLSAVRDNRPRLDDEDDAEWFPVDSRKNRLPGYGRAPQEFGYVMNGELVPGFGGWAVSPERGIEWRTEIRLRESATVTLQIIGRPNTSHLSRYRLLPCLPDVPPGHPNCATSHPSGKAKAFQILMTLPAGRHRIRLPIAPVANPQPEDRDLPLALRGGRIEWLVKRERYAGRLTKPRAPATFVLRTADGEALTREDGSGVPTEFALNNGLAGLIGYGPDYANAISGSLAGSAIDVGGEARLTLDSGLQTIAQTELERRLNEKWDQHDSYRRERRGAVVVLDVRSGAILAAANYPNPPPGTNRWDRAAFSITWPNRDPFRFTPWQVLDAHMTPGSTFKVVTSLTAIKAAGEGRSDVAAMLKGWGAGDFLRGAGLSPTASGYQPRGASMVHNAGSGSLARSFYKPLRNPACQKGIHSTGLGVREAVRDSLNIWFVRLGEVMDRRNLEGGGPNTRLAQNARALGFGSRLPLFPEIGGVNNDDSGLAVRGVLRALTGDLDLFHPELGASMQRLAQNSFGQGVRATPLQMARVATVAASGRLVWPTLLSSWEGRKVGADDAQPLELDPAYFALLRQGMKAVPEVGTAAGAFGSENPRDRCRTYGKTGTAQSLVKPKLFSGWFIGWREDQSGQPDIAFACVLTHSVNGSGGDLCGRTVARILKQWDR